MEKLLEIYIYNGVDVEPTPFPNTNEQVEILNFDYSARRMGEVPTITATFLHRLCLDNKWNENVYVEFNDEKFFLKQIPTSSKSNTDARYKYDVTFVSERQALNDVYLFDVVDADSSDKKFVTNSTRFEFNGTVWDLAQRINESLKNSKVPYSVFIPDNHEIPDFVTNEYKNISFSDVYIANAIQEFYNTFEIPYYFDGKVVYLGNKSDSTLTETFEYGAKNALLSIAKNNANYKIVNRITGTGSSENIPYYYPNPTPMGFINFYRERSSNKTPIDNLISIVDTERFNAKFRLSTKLKYLNNTIVNSDISTYKDEEYKNATLAKGEKDSKWNTGVVDAEIRFDITNPAINGEHVIQIILDDYAFNLLNTEKGSLSAKLYYQRGVEGDGVKEDILFGSDGWKKKFRVVNSKGEVYKDYVGEKTFLDADTYQINLSLWFSCDKLDEVKNVKSYLKTNQSVKVNVEETVQEIGWYADDVLTTLESFGLSYSDTPLNGDIIYAEQEESTDKIPECGNLMPSIYRESGGAERFYSAIDASEIEKIKYNVKDAYIDPSKGNGEYYTFSNLYNGVNPKEHTISFEDIKPTIAEMTYNGERIDMFADVAFDNNDNNDKVIKEEGSNEYVFVHPYFFIKLKKLGFNLFDRALPQGNITINMTSGHCSGCAFEVAVEDKNKRNTVQVDENGTLKRDENGNVLFGTPQDEQNNTTDNEVWIAVKKDNQSFSTQATEYVYPDSKNNIVPTTEDTFVITNILLPNEYIYAAEKRLDEELLAYMWQNNHEKFTFSIKFSRIYLAENPHILKALNENATVKIRYNNTEYTLYVSSFNYKVKNNESLPEIEVELTDTLTIAQNALQNALNEVKMSVVSIGQSNVLKTGNKYFTRKDVDDTVQGRLALQRGANFGAYAKSRSGAAILEDDKGEWNVEADTITVRDKVEGNLNVDKDVNINKGNLTLGGYEEHADGSGKGASIYKDSNEQWQVTSDNLKVRNEAHFNNGLTTGNFVEGVADGTGAAIHGSNEKGWTVEADYLKVRRKAVFNSVEIFHTQHIGGGRISSAAGCIIDFVEPKEVDNVKFYRCYFKKQDTEGRLIFNKWVVGDQAQCKTFNLEQTNDTLKGNHYYWRLVTGTSNSANGTTKQTDLEYTEDAWVTDGEDTIFIHEYHWIDLCDSEYYSSWGAGYDVNSDIPQKGDDVFLLGHRFDTNKNRQTAIYEVAGESEVPYYRQYVGIKSFSLDGCLEQQLMPNDNILTGRVKITGGSGWEKLDGLPTKIDATEKTAQSALKQSGEAKEQAGNALSSAKEAKTQSEAVRETVENLSYSASNLLRNTGFYGDDKSVRLKGESMMNVDEEMLSPSLEHWQTGGIAYSDETQLGSLSGYDLVLSIDTASQQVVTGVNANEKYVLTLRGEGMIGISIGGYETMIELTQKRIVHRFRTASSASTFTLQGLSPDTRICEVMLEQGDVASNTWNRSVLDVSPEISRLQNLQYIMNALRSKAGTEILGGLVLSSMIMLSKETDSETFSNEDISCGMNGIWANNSSVAFWGGGTFQQANESVRLVYSNPTYEPTEEELENMANYVVTHDGTVIMNRAIVRGTVFAENGQFKGKVFATDGEFKGAVYAKEGEFNGKVTATSGSFKGHVEADSGTFKGKIEATSGTFGDMELGTIDEEGYNISAREDSDGWIKFYSNNERWTWIAGSEQALQQANMYINRNDYGYGLFVVATRGGTGIQISATTAINSDGNIALRSPQQNGRIEMNDDKIILRFGSYAIKIDDSGIKKTSNGEVDWVDI